jgi:exosortase A-associated hydrolase 2
VAVLAIDLGGCGDSAGGFEEASWGGWENDVEAGIDWLRGRHERPVWLWGMRCGALLATHAAATSEEPSCVLLWQPVVSGHQHLTQFLRTKVAAAAIGGGDRGTGVAGMLERILNGGYEDVAGYRISPGLAAGLDRSALAQPPAGSRVCWFDVASSEDARLSPVTLSWAQRWRAAGCDVDARTIPGPPFWQTVEINECPRLIEQTKAIVDRFRA